MDLSRLESIVEKELEGKGGAHDFSHVKRVLNIAKEIADRNDNVDIRLLSAMCLLHDIIRIEGEKEDESPQLSAERSKVLLKECGFAEDDIIKVIEGIKSHSLASRGGEVADMVREPETIEEKILFDADKIDALGPIGIARWFFSVSKRNWGLKRSAGSYLRIMNNFLKLKGGLYTVHGTALAEKRIEYSRRYMEDLLEQLENG